MDVVKLLKHVCYFIIRGDFQSKSVPGIRRIPRNWPEAVGAVVKHKGHGLGVELYHLLCVFWEHLPELL
jgi:hypothetical protein